MDPENYTAGTWCRSRPSPVTPEGPWPLSRAAPSLAGRVSSRRFRGCPLVPAQPEHCSLGPPSAPSHGRSAKPTASQSFAPSPPGSLLSTQAFRCCFLCKLSLHGWHPSLLPRGFSEAGSIQCRCSCLRHVFAMPSAEPREVPILEHYTRAPDFAH